MALKVIYFSRSGRSKAMAEQIAKATSAPLIEVTDTQNWSGLFGYLRAGRYTMTDKQYAFSVSGEVQPDDELIVLSPLWAGGPAQTIRLFLKDKNLKKVHLVLTSKGSTANKLDRSLYSSVTDIVASLKNDEFLLAKFIKQFKK